MVSVCYSYIFLEKQTNDQSKRKQRDNNRSLIIVGHFHDC